MHCQLATTTHYMRMEPVIQSTCTCIWMTLGLLMNRNVCLAHLKRPQLIWASRSGYLLLTSLSLSTSDGSGLKSTLTE